MKRFDLKSNWKFNIADENPYFINANEWLPAKVPGTVHTDLIDNKVIPEPFFDDNELKQGWIANPAGSIKLISAGRQILK